MKIAKEKNTNSLPKATSKTTHVYPPVSEASREVANLIERKNLHGVKEFVCLSVCDKL